MYDYLKASRAVNNTFIGTPFSLLFLLKHNTNEPTADGIEYKFEVQTKIIPDEATRIHSQLLALENKPDVNDDVLVYTVIDLCESTSRIDADDTTARMQVVMSGHRKALTNAFLTNSSYLTKGTHAVHAHPHGAHHPAPSLPHGAHHSASSHTGSGISHLSPSPTTMHTPSFSRGGGSSSTSTPGPTAGPGKSSRLAPKSTSSRTHDRPESSKKHTDRMDLEDMES
jgi:hypothetical protein